MDAKARGRTKAAAEKAVIRAQVALAEAAILFERADCPAWTRWARLMADALATDTVPENVSVSLKSV